jgi:uncharacterized protein YceH (UPF0502 family)
MENNNLSILNQEELRVLGSLIEKSKTTPDYYPLTLNALHAACNQKSSRNPVLELDEETIVEAINSLKKKQFVANVIGGGSRAIKYRHTMAVKFPLDPAETSILCLLFLRGPLTSGEINSNSGRLYEFDSLEEVQQTLENLSNYENPFVKLLAKKAGQKEARYFHCFSDDSIINQYDSFSPNSSKNNELEFRVEKLEQELFELKEKFEKLYNELM